MRKSKKDVSADLPLGTIYVKNGVRRRKALKSVDSAVVRHTTGTRRCIAWLEDLAKEVGASPALDEEFSRVVDEAERLGFLELARKSLRGELVDAR